MHYDIGAPFESDGDDAVSYVLDRSTGKRERTAFLPNGKKTNARALQVSNNGRIALLETGGRSVLVRNLATNKTLRVNTAPSGRFMRTHVQEAVINATNGRFAAWISSPRGGGIRQVWVHDRKRDVTKLVSRARGGGFANAESRDITISADGRSVAFVSAATNLPARNGAPGQQFEALVRDMRTGKMFNVNRSGSGEHGNAGTCRGKVYRDRECIALSGDGRYAAFWSFASNLVPGDTNGTADLFLRDLNAGTVERVNVSPTGQQNTTAGTSIDPFVAITPDARYVFFRSEGSLSPEHTPQPGVWRSYLRDRR